MGTSQHHATFNKLALDPTQLWASSPANIIWQMSLFSISVGGEGRDLNAQSTRWRQKQSTSRDNFEMRIFLHICRSSSLSDSSRRKSSFCRFCNRDSGGVPFGGCRTELRVRAPTGLIGCRQTHISNPRFRPMLQSTPPLPRTSPDTSCPSFFSSDGDQGTSWKPRPLSIIAKRPEDRVSGWR